MGGVALHYARQRFLLGDDFVIPTNARALQLSFWVEQRFSAALEAQNESGFSR
jgi:hypothetical protein